MKSETSTSDVIIAGGGFVGMAAAAALADGRRRVVVLEARTAADPRFRGELIHPRGADVLADLGLLAPLLRAGGTEVEGFAVVPGPGRAAVLLPYESRAKGRSRAPRGLSMDHHPMVATLRAEVAKRPGVELRSGAKVTGFLRAGERVVGVETAEGERFSAELTLVAEGRHSKLRGQLGVEAEARLLSFTAAILVDHVELPHAAHGHVFLGAPGPVLAYPLGDGRARMCVDVPASAEKGAAALARLLEEAYAPFVPEPLRAAMLRAVRAGEVELCANHAIRTRRCAAPGVALIGDAAGCCHPLTAAGMTLGLHDVGVLADELGAAPNTDTALLRYQRRRYQFARGREALTDALYEVMRGDDGGARAVLSGMIEYWRGSARARSASMALLSGQESSLGVFAAEYLRVVGRAASGVLRGDAEDPSWSGRAASMSGLLRTSYGEIERSVSSLYDDKIGRRGAAQVSQP
jgi:2-polyprenyl-6-methoxyphenol hydroxylase-like FAD-dependent oxidoreductase